MRNLIVAILLGVGAVQAAPPGQPVNLDAPGALERLRSDRPEHYAKVVEEMDKVQAVPFSPRAMHDLRLIPEQPDPTRRHVETSHPAKTRMTVVVDDVAYAITVLYTKNPATLSRVK